MDSLKSPRCITILVLVTVFALGMLTGWSLSMGLFKQKSDRMMDLNTELKPAVLEEFAVRKMKEKFNLTDEQVHNIRPILTSGIAEVIQLRKDSLKKIVACRTKILNQMLPYLTPDQGEIIRLFIRTKDEELKEQLGEN